MNTEENFSAHPVGEEMPKRKRVVRRRKLAPPDEQLEEKKIKRIDQELKSIYEDKGGRLPNMRVIKKRKKHPVLRAIFSLLILGGLMAAVAWTGFFYLPNKKQVEADNLKLTINGPTELTIDATTTYVIQWKNKQNINISSAVLTVNYPEGFIYLDSSLKPANSGATEWKLDDMAAGGGGELKITGRNYGALNQQKSWRIFLNYRPENFASELQAMVSLGTQIASSPVAVTVSGPDRAIIGDEVEYTFTVNNDGAWQPKKILLRPVWPANFYVSSSTPQIGKDSIWTIASSPSTTTSATPVMTFKASGKFADISADTVELPDAEVKAVLELPFGADQRLFTIGETALKTQLAKNIQTFSLAINGTMSDFGSQPGEMLNLTVYLKNSGLESMKNVALTLALDAPALNKQSALNWAEIDDQLDGTIIGEQINDKSRRGTITWTSRQSKALTELKPGQEVSIDIKLPIRDTSNFDLASIGEYLIKAAAETTFKDKTGAEKTIGSNPIVITLNSDLSLEVRDTAAGDNRDIIWVLTNNFHPLKNIELSATMFGDVSLVTASSAPAGAVSHDDEAKTISWKIDEMPEGVDTLALPFTIVVNKINPTQNTLVSKVRVRAEDTITGQTIEFMGDEVPMKEE
jgi:hypothetical protein